ncbi:MAG TPA: hypothetical protein DCZ48_06685, partial [Methylococcaceae bacterium]|nr:hypothetical protein [Methylococcaceae bacterium]
MISKRKLTGPFILALTLHVLLLSVFKLSFDSKSPVFETGPAPEIIEAMVIDESLIQAEAERLKTQQNKLLESQRQMEEAKRQEDEKL